MELIPSTISLVIKDKMLINTTFQTDHQTTQIVTVPQ